MELQYAPALRESYTPFANNFENQINNVGILAINGVEILNIQKVNDEMAPRYRELEEYYSNENFDCFKISMNLSVNEETKYFENGFHERLVILVKDDGKWYVGASSKYSNISRGTGQGFLDGDIKSPPSTIKVGIHDNSTWSNPSITGTPKDINFNDFVRTAVYGEIGTQGYQAAAIRAVTVSDRMFSWWCVLGSYRDTYGCDIVGGFDVAYSASNVGKGSESFKSTVNLALSNYVLSSGKQFFSVGANNYTDRDYAGSGHVVQSGANKLAKEGYTWQKILHHYLDNSKYNWPDAGIVIIG